MIQNQGRYSHLQGEREQTQQGTPVVVQDRMYKYKVTQEAKGNTKVIRVKPSGKDTNDIRSEPRRPNIGPEADLENNLVG